MSKRFQLSIAVLACALVTLRAASVCAQTQSVTIAWDPSPDPSVIGYVVYVGTQPDGPREKFEIEGTSFVYPNAVSGRPYFFSVAASSGGGRTGSPSDEVLFLAGGNTVVSVSSRGADATPSHDGNRDAPALAPAMQSDSRPVDSLGDFGRIDTLRALGDGRLILIEDDARILIVNPDREDVRTSAAVATGSARFTSLAVDPQFVVTHLIYVAEVETSRDGDAQIDVARYREVNGRLGERAVVISGLPISGEGDARIALDGLGHLFVALPDADGGRADSYAGMVLRFLTDGSLPTNNRAASPVFARGVSQPAALEWESSSNSLWLVDGGSQAAASLRRVWLDRESVNWPMESEVVDVSAHDGSPAPLDGSTLRSAPTTDLSHGFVIAGQPAELIAITEDPSGALRTTVLPRGLLEGEPTAVVQDEGALDVAVRAGVNSEIRTRIVRLRSLPSGR